MDTPHSYCSYLYGYGSVLLRIAKASMLEQQ